MLLSGARNSDQLLFILRWFLYELSLRSSGLAGDYATILDYLIFQVYKMLIIIISDIEGL